MLFPVPGRNLARLPVDPLYAKVLLVSGDMKCAEEALAIVAMVSSDTIFFTPRCGGVLLNWMSTIDLFLHWTVCLDLQCSSLSFIQADDTHNKVWMERWG